MTIHFDADEGTTVTVSCLACHHDRAVLASARPVMMYARAIICDQCGRQQVAFDQISMRVTNHFSKEAA